MVQPAQEPTLLPESGQIVTVRSRQYLVEGVTLPKNPTSATAVRLSCVDDDAQGEPLEVLWEREPDALVLTCSSAHEACSLANAIVFVDFNVVT